MEVLNELWSVLSIGLARAAEFFTHPASAFGPAPLFATIVLAVIFSARKLRRSGPPVSVRRIIREAFPREIYLSKSALRDFVVLVLNESMFFVFASAAIITVHASLRGVGALDQTRAAVLPAGVEIVLLSVYFTLILDFFSTFSHYLKHKAPFLWEFHKTHHSAPVMTPITAMRRHPVDMIVNGFVITAGVAIGLIAWSAIFASDLAPAKIYGASIGVFLWRMSVYNLRHSHIWIDYGPLWSRIFISPAQHQIHHSNEPRHHDRNYGLIFAFWDSLLGTLYVPEADERVTFGIAAEEMEGFKTVRGMYLTPFRNLFRRRRKSDGRADGALERPGSAA